MLSALPEDNEQDKRMKVIVRNNCTACHTASYVLQHRFDEAGWSAIVELMKNVNVYGIYRRRRAGRRPASSTITRRSSPPISRKARGPGENGMKVKLEPRASGEAARVVFKEYDVPLDADAGLPANFVQNDGSDWSLGTPSVMIPGWGVHDAWLDFQGDLWFTCNIPNKQITIGRISTKTGAVKLFAVPGPQGLTAQTHGMTRDPNGIIWFNVNPGRGGLGRMDPEDREASMCSFRRPACRRPAAPPRSTTTARARSGSSSPDGALRFDPDTGQFTEFKSITYKTPNGTGVTYGAAADRDGNGWWAEMVLDIIGKGNVATGKAEEVKLAPVKAELDRVTPEARKFYETYNQPDFNSPLPWAQGPRRMGTDKDDDVLWVGNSWGANLARINTKTNETTYVPLPNRQQPYHVHVDKRAQALDQPVGRRPGDALRSEVRRLDGVRSADARRRAALHFAARARWRADAGGAALLPGQEGRDHDAAQRGRTQGTQRPGRTAMSCGCVPPGRPRYRPVSTQALRDLS